MTSKNVLNLFRFAVDQEQKTSFAAKSIAGDIAMPFWVVLVLTVAAIAAMTGFHYYRKPPGTRLEAFIADFTIQIFNG